jgi:spore cortex formation protein SpoVR/YcgB (stage V sporulation)
MFQDIKRICQAPTAEDLKWFPDICNTDWIDTCDNIMRNYRDESFVLQFLSPKVIRDFKLFTLASNDGVDYLRVDEVHDDEDVISLRKELAASYDIGNKIPRLEITEVDDDGCLMISHISEYRLHYPTAAKTLHHLIKLWGRPVELRYVDLEGNDVNEI